MQHPPLRRNRIALACTSVFLLSGALVACAAEPPGATGASSPAAAAATAKPGADTVLARVNGVAITQGEVEASIAGELLALERQRNEAIENGVTAKVQEVLLDAAAKKQGQTKDEWVKAEVDKQSAALAQDKVDAFYNARAQQIRQPKEQVEPQIRQYLAYQDLISGLEAAAKIEMLTTPFRIDVPAVGPSKGPANAPVTIVEFGDFECPPCGMAYKTVKQVRETYGDKVRVVFRQFPLRSIHPHAEKAGEASMCAGDQGKFWEMHDYLFENQRKLEVADIKTAAAAMAGIDAAAFDSCLDSGKYTKHLDEEIEAGTKVGVNGTPSFYVNGRPLSGVPSIEAFSAAIDDELRRAKSE